jgi:uncharacterized membrane protein YcjF (UPF0283 family)
VKQFVREIFQDEDHLYSMSRTLTAVAVVASVFCVVYVTLITKRLPDAASLIAMGGFMVAPYSINQARAAFDAFKSQTSAPLPASPASPIAPATADAGVLPPVQGPPHMPS